MHERLRNGQLMTHVAMGEDSASARYTAELPTGVTTNGLWLALLAVVLAALFGGMFGRALATDLALATQQVSSLGTEVVLRGKARVAGPARFGVVAQLGRSVEALAERFRVFAAASERALEVRASAQRMKQLLFASVSHDLKSPLNAILGFAELVRDEPLTKPQEENLDLVSSRGRELLALIETILDAARVEAGQLRLVRQPVPIRDLIDNAIEKARDLHGPQFVDALIEVPPSMPPVQFDAQYGARAVAVLIAHAMDSATGTRGKQAVRIRGGVAPVSDKEHRGMARILIEFVSSLKRPSMLEAQLRGKLHSGAGRGMVLRLSLARAIIELHGGAVDVERATTGAAIVTCWLPLSAVERTLTDTAEELDMVEAPTLVMPPRR